MALQEVPKATKYLSMVMLVAWIGQSMVWNFLPLYFERHIQNFFLIGFLVSLPPLVTILMDIPVSNYVQRVGEKFVFFGGLIANVLPAIAYLGAAPIFIVTGKLFEGVTKSLIWNSGWSLSLKTSNEDTEGEAISIFLLGVNLAAVLGPIIGGYLLLSYGFQLPFLIWILTSTVAILVFISYIGYQPESDAIGNFEELFKQKTYIEDFHHLKQNWSNIKPVYTLIFLHSIIFSFYWLAVPLALDEVGASFVEMGLIFGLAALPSAFQIFFGRFADRIGRHKSLIIFSAMLTPVLVGMYFSQSVLTLGLLFFVAAALTNGMSPPIHTMLDLRAPEEVESELVGFMELFKHIGQFAGPLIAGSVASTVSLSASFAAAGVVSAAILLYSARLYSLESLPKS